MEKKLKGNETEPGVEAMLASTRGGQWPKNDLGLKISPLLEAMRSINMLRFLEKLHWLWLGMSEEIWGSSLGEGGVCRRE